MSVYPKWMEKRCCAKVTLTIPEQMPSASGGATMVRVEKPIPKVLIKKVVILDDYENINITVLKVIDLSLGGGSSC